MDEKAGGVQLLVQGYTQLVRVDAGILTWLDLGRETPIPSHSNPLGTSPGTQPVLFHILMRAHTRAHTRTHTGAAPPYTLIKLPAQAPNQKRRDC